jgi:hypothetical protein
MSAGSPCNLVAALASEFDAVAVEKGDAEPFSSSTYTVSVLMSDGREVEYRIALEARGSQVGAREQTPDRLPKFCPQLHINADSTFCTGWSGDSSLEVVDEPSARDWWRRLHGFLRLQHRAKRLRRWPEVEWAHGDAAQYQRAAERAARELGPEFLEDLAAGRLHVEWERKVHPVHGRLLNVQRQGKIFYRVSERRRRVLNQRQACICLSGDLKRHRRLRSCGDHARSAVDLAFALESWHQAESRFWKSFQSKQCCGRVDGCPLASSMKQNLDNEDMEET